MKVNRSCQNERQYPGLNRYSHLFTVLIITYNRAKLVERALMSVSRQGTKDLEVIVVDDGSKDGTRQVVRRVQAVTGINIRYMWHENSGKPASHNMALSEIRGYFTIVLDSDDVLADEILPRLDHWWNTIPIEKRQWFAGVEGLCADLASKCIMGDPFPMSPMDSNFLETRYRHKVSGDKRHIIRTDVMREFPFPLFPGEKEMRESIVWCRMAHRYKFRYVNEIVQFCEQIPGGLTSRARQRRLSSPNNFRLAYLELLNLHGAYLTLKDQYKAMVRYIRHSTFAGVPAARQLQDLHPNKRVLWFVANPEGVIGALKDRFVVKHVLQREENPKNHG